MLRQAPCGPLCKERTKSPQPCTGPDWVPLTVVHCSQELVAGLDTGLHRRTARDPPVLERGQLEGGAVLLEVADEGADDDRSRFPVAGACALEPGAQLGGVQLGDGALGPERSGHASRTRR
jgi:hypothetical protein